jgi:hypothetical protein
MKLDRFKNMNENREMYFVSDRKITEEEQKYTIIEKLSQNWSEKLKQDYLVPRSLYRYSLDELKEIEKFYLNENIDYDMVGRFMKEHGWGDIMNTERVEEFENSDYYKGGYKSDEEYTKDFVAYMSSIADGSIEEVNESVRIVEPKNNDLEVALAELKEKHGSNVAVEDIRLEGNEIVFDVKCETDIQGTTEYNGFNLRYNKLCIINDYEQIDEHQIFEQINHWKIKL